MATYTVPRSLQDTRVPRLRGGSCTDCVETLGAPFARGMIERSGQPNNTS
jgi:hypothetical protein